MPLFTGVTRGMCLAPKTFHSMWGFKCRARNLIPSQAGDFIGQTCYTFGFTSTLVVLKTNFK